MDGAPVAKCSLERLQVQFCMRVALLCVVMWFVSTARLSHPVIFCCHAQIGQLQLWASHIHTWPSTKTRAKTRWRLTACAETVKRTRMERLGTSLSSPTWSSLAGTASRVRRVRAPAESREVLGGLKPLKTSFLIQIFLNYVKYSWLK